MTIPVSSFSSDGVDVGSKDRNLAYLYGIADFFSFIFEDTDTINLMLEANAVKASEVYSRFLQLTSSISIAGIQEQVGSGIELILLAENDQVGNLPKFRIDKPFNSAKFLANRPFLPTQILEQDVDFRIIQESTTSCILQLARPIDTYQFSRRPLSDGTTQYAIWLTDVAIDEQLMYKHYGKLLGVEPEVSSEQFSNFVYGLYYMYMHGPALSLLEQGLNLVLGIPLPRNESVVLDIRSNVDTGQYLIITQNMKYLLPVGVMPIVGIGDTINVGTPVAKWIELKDFISDGKWWLNVSIPESIIRVKPKNQLDRFAKLGNRFDELMTEYLFRNTFLIRINVGSFKDNKYFEYLSDILSNAKPSGTQAIFVWKINMDEDEFGLIEEIGFTIDQINSILRSISAHPINVIGIN